MHHILDNIFVFSHIGGRNLKDSKKIVRIALFGFYISMTTPIILWLFILLFIIPTITIIMFTIIMIISIIVILRQMRILQKMKLIKLPMFHIAFVIWGIASIIIVRDLTNIAWWYYIWYKPFYFYIIKLTFILFFSASFIFFCTSHFSTKVFKECHDCKKMFTSSIFLLGMTGCIVLLNISEVHRYLSSVEYILPYLVTFEAFMFISFYLILIKSSRKARSYIKSIISE